MRRRLFAILPVLLAALFCLPVRAANDACTLYVNYEDEGGAIQNAGFRFYKVADISEFWEYTLTEPFADSDAALKINMDNSEWTEAAEILARHARGKEPAASAKTDKNGSITIAGLEEGLYLVKGDPVTIGKKTYTPQPYCVALPGLDADGNKIYEVVTEPKFDMQSGAENGTLTLTKTVEGAGDTNRVWHFTVILEQAVDGVRGDMVFNGGVAEVLLRHGETATAVDLPEGAGYTVKEAEADTGGYTTTAVNASGVIDLDTQVRFVNTFTLNPGKNPPDTGTAEYYKKLFAAGGMLLFAAGACIIMRSRKRM